MSTKGTFQSVVWVLLAVGSVAVASTRAATVPELGACCYDDGQCRVTQPEMCASLIGDANCDGAIDFDDISPFVAVLSGGSIPGCQPGNCDINRDGAVTFDDVDPFVALLGNQHYVHGNFLGAGTACAQCPPRLGDTCANPFIATEPLPFSIIGNTCSFANDYDEMCPFDSMARDVVYQFSPAQDVTVDISLCLDETDYDTKVYVYDTICFGWWVACNDDGCSTPTYPDPYLSKVESVALTGGHTYYIVVDGYAQECGTYRLEIRETPTCEVPCPPGATPEGEPCHTDTNGGCNSVPPLFGSITCGETICGTSYFDSYARDTDWYMVNGLTGANIFTLTGEAEFDLQLLFITDTGNDCVGYTNLIATAGPCQVATIVTAVSLDTYYVRAGPQFSTIDCTEGNPQYWVHLDCHPIPSGACCKSGICYDGYMQSDCNAIGGEYEGDNTHCAEITCWVPPQGEACDDPFIVTEPLPFDVAGETCSFGNDYDEVCPYSGSASPDVAYSYTPSADVRVDINLCNDGTDYDTKLYVYEGACPGALIACNDDSCSSPQYPNWVSRLPDVNLLAGHTYYIIVDGYGFSCGNYHMTITELGPCMECPPNSTPEGEPCYTDTNGGCGSEPPVYGHIACGETICGTSYFDGEYWDTDWFLIDLPVGYADYIFTLRGRAEFDLQLVLIRDDAADCEILTLVGGQGDACETLEVVFNCTTASSTYYAWVGPQLLNLFDCADGHGRYWIEVTCVGCDIWAGACCKSGICHPDMFPADCDALGGTWQGPGTNCDPNPCPPPPLGDTCADPVVIPPMLPFDTTGNTRSFAHDYDAVCPYNAPGAPDIVYRFTPSFTEVANITLCMDETDYDTKLYVYEDSCSDTPIACNDDVCATAGYPQHPYVSRIQYLLLYPGHDYYIVVDGYGSACGTYRLIVIPPPP